MIMDTHGLSRRRKKDKTAPLKNNSSIAEQIIAAIDSNIKFSAPVSSIGFLSPTHSSLIPVINMTI